jgi:beta-lactam-binding protein with PASTA domain
MSDAFTPTRRKELRPMPIWAWGAIGAVIVLLFAVGIGIFLGNRATVPGLVGKPSGAAGRELTGLGLTLGPITKVATSAPLGTVLAQSPAAGTELMKGDAVAISVAVAPPGVSVPGVLGRTAGDAQAAVSGVGLAPQVFESFDASAPTGTVMGQVPIAGATVPRGAAVVLLVSRGAVSTTATVPAVVGATQASATATLVRHGFKVLPFDGYSATVATGNIIGTIPSARQKVEAGSQVEILVSRGTPTSLVTVPSLVGTRQPDAVTVLAGLGLAVQAFLAPSDTVPVGTVVSQLPKAGWVTAKGAAVGLLVSTGKPGTMMAVPRLIGLSESDARAAAAAAGFVAQPVASLAAAAPGGAVFAQLPQAGSTALVGSPLIYLVSKGQVK